jgi:hypothetical protein
VHKSVRILRMLCSKDHCELEMKDKQHSARETTLQHFSPQTLYLYRMTLDLILRV